MESKALKDKIENFSQYQIALVDITQSKLAEQTYWKPPKYDREVIETIREPLVVLNRNLKVVYANHSFCRVFQVTPEETEGQFICTLGNRQLDIPRLREMLASAFAENTIIENFQVDHEFPKIGRRIMRLNARRINRRANEKQPVLLALEDRTAQKRSEMEIRLLSRQLARVQEIERQRISFDLHDHVASDLSSLKLNLEIFFNQLPALSAEMRTNASKFIDILINSIKKVRDLSYELLPPELEKKGLVFTVSQYCKDYAGRTGLSVRFQPVNMSKLRLEPDIEINLFRVLQEALNNIKMHAAADNVTIQMVHVSPNILLQIKDDGQGFDLKHRLVKALRERRMGIGSMESRISLLDGNIKIQSRPGAGTQIFIKVPCKEKQNGSEEKYSDYR